MCRLGTNLVMSGYARKAQIGAGIPPGGLHQAPWRILQSLFPEASDGGLSPTQVGLSRPAGGRTLARTCVRLQPGVLVKPSSQAKITLALAIAKTRMCTRLLAGI